LGTGAATSIFRGGRASLGATSLTLRHGSRSLRERLVSERWQEHESGGNNHDWRSTISHIPSDGA